MFCPRCGNNNENTARYCFSCGQRFAQTNQPPGPSGPEWSQFQDPAPAPPPTPAPPPPPPPVYAPPPSQIAVAPPPRKASNPALAVAVLAGVVIVLAGAFLLTRDDGESGGGSVLGSGGGIDLSAGVTPAPDGPRATPLATPAPVVGPGYKLTAIFVTPPATTTQPNFDKRIYDAMVAGVSWEGAAQLYGRRYPLQFVFNNATTNLLLQRHNPDDAKKQLRDAGFTTQGPKLMLAFNPGDRAFAVWLIEQMRGLGYTVVTDANNFSAEEKAKGYYGLILDVIPQ